MSRELFRVVLIE
jgi:3-hydroxybutyryl-CoA dehydrogenase